MRARALSAALLCLVASACYRTVYRDLLPPDMPPAVETPDTLSKSPPGGWQSFFLWGWVPTEKRIDAAKICGGEGHVARIETRQTFAQGLIQSLAGYYINIYAPYNGAVKCDHTLP